MAGVSRPGAEPEERIAGAGITRRQAFFAVALLLSTAAMAVSGGLYLLGARSLGRDLALVRKTVHAREAAARP